MLCLKLSSVCCAAGRHTTVALPCHGQRSARASGAGATWKPAAAELLAAYPILAAVCGEGDAQCHATRDRFPVQSAGHLGPVPGLEGWRLAGERRERRNLQHLQHHDALQAACGAEIVVIISGRRSCAMAWCWAAAQLSASTGYSRLTPRTCARALGSSAASLPAAFSHPRTSRSLRGRMLCCAARFCATTTRTFWCLISFIGNKTSTRRTTLSWRGASPCPWSAGYALTSAWQLWWCRSSSCPSPRPSQRGVSGEIRL